MNESGYNYNTLVRVFSHTVVFKQTHHLLFETGPVALKVTAAPPGNSGLHPSRHEASVYSILCPHSSIPEFVECEEDWFDTSLFIAEKFHCGRQRLPVLVTQFVKAASVDRLFYTFPIIRWSVALQVAKQVVVVLQHIHSRGVVYGDLKLPNVLVGSGGYVWLVDFSSAVIMWNPSATGSGERSVVAREHLAQGITMHVRPPELFPHVETGGGGGDPVAAVLQHLFMVDFWVFGVFFLELLTGRPCWGSFDVSSDKLAEEELHAKVLDGCELVRKRYSGMYRGSGVPRKPGEVWKALRDLLLGLLQRNPEKRLGFTGGWTAVLQHHFFKCTEPDHCKPFPEEYDEEIDELMLGL